MHWKSTHPIPEFVCRSLEFSHYILYFYLTIGDVIIDFGILKENVIKNEPKYSTDIFVWSRTDEGKWKILVKILYSSFNNRISLFNAWLPSLRLLIITNNWRDGILWLTHKRTLYHFYWSFFYSFHLYFFSLLRWNALRHTVYSNVVHTCVK